MGQVIYSPAFHTDKRSTVLFLLRTQDFYLHVELYKGLESGLDTKQIFRKA